jgi:aryl-alcohol dehydrogenase-like predicted oxidoreductase
MAEHARLPACLAEPRGHRLRCLLQLASNVLLIPGTASLAHLRDNLAAENVTLDNEALRDLDGVRA